jgi:hypothetical protein
MSLEIAKMYPCRYSFCGNPANGKYACCSKECRAKVPTCKEPGCKNATEPGIWKGSAQVYSAMCYNHGGRIEFDQEPQNHMKREKLTYIKTKNGWVIRN